MVPGLEMNTPMDTSLKELINARMNAEISPERIFGITVRKNAGTAGVPRDRAASSMEKSKLLIAEPVVRMI